MLEHELKGFTGTQQYYKHLCGLVYTDGIKHLVTHGKCMWLLDVIASYQPDYKSLCPFQIWKVTKESDGSGWILMKEDSDRPPTIIQRMEYTDFPMDSYEIYCIDGVVLLKSEY